MLEGRLTGLPTRPPVEPATLPVAENLFVFGLVGPGPGPGLPVTLFLFKL